MKWPFLRFKDHAWQASAWCPACNEHSGCWLPTISQVIANHICPACGTATHFCVVRPIEDTGRWFGLVPFRPRRLYFRRLGQNDGPIPAAFE